MLDIAEHDGHYEGAAGQAQLHRGSQTGDGDGDGPQEHPGGDADESGDKLRVVEVLGRIAEQGRGLGHGGLLAHYHQVVGELQHVGIRDQEFHVGAGHAGSHHVVLGLQPYFFQRLAYHLFVGHYHAGMEDAAGQLLQVRFAP